MTLCFKNISHAYDDTQVLCDLDLTVKPGDITCLLGPSGGGKSTLLRLAAGLEHLQSGSIELEGRTLCSTSYAPPPEKRPVGLMFQENALFPHMTVRENIGFGLSHLSKDARDQRIESLLGMVNLSDLAQRFPHQLSGGQQQRVALVRSIAPEPRVLLMDEPYASIDITLRRTLREAARQILKSSGTTTIMVTHDPSEAMEMADVIAVLDAGKIVQIGSPQDLYEHPDDACVAALFGDAQRFKAEYRDNAFASPYGAIEWQDQNRSLSAGTYDLVLRPDGLSIKLDADARSKIIDLRYVGNQTIAFVQPESGPASIAPLRVTVGRSAELSISDRVSLSASNVGFFVFDKGS